MKKVFSTCLISCIPFLGFAAEEYVGNQLPVVFAGPISYCHDNITDAIVLIDGRFLSTDSYVGKIDRERLFPILDAGSPKLVTSVIIQGGSNKGGGSADTDEVNTRRMGSFRIYGSNDLENWDLFWEGHEHPVSAYWILRVTRDSNTGASAAYKLETSKTPTMSTAEELGTFDDSSYPYSTRYRYFRLESSPNADYKTINASEFSLWSPDLAITANRPTVYSAAESLGAADDPNGVTFSGKLTYSPTGSADVYVAIHKNEFGADLDAWEANGATIVKLAEGIASGSSFSVKVPNLGEGTLTSRIFAVAGDTTTAAPCSYRFALGAKAVYPTVYVSNNSIDGISTSHIQNTYDGNLGSYGDANNGHNAHFVFDLTEIKANGYHPVAIRFWPRKGSLSVEKLRGRTTVIAATSDDIDFPKDMTSLSSDTRTMYLDSANTQKNANWTIVEDLSWTQIDYQPLCYDVAIPKDIALSAKYLKIYNVTMVHAREYEVRVMCNRTMMIIIK